MLNSEEAYEKAKNAKPKDTRYVLKYIDKQIKYACNQGKFCIILNNKITKGHYFGKNQYYYIYESPKVIDTLHTKGYDVDFFQGEIKISWAKQKKGI